MISVGNSPLRAKPTAFQYHSCMPTAEGYPTDTPQVLSKVLRTQREVTQSQVRLEKDSQTASLLDNPNWKTFEERNGLRRVYFDGCMLGVHGKYYPIRKPWCVSTNSLNLIQHLSQCQCDHSHEHEPAEGSQTTQTGFYPDHSRSTVPFPIPQAYSFACHKEPSP